MGHEEMIFMSVPLFSIVFNEAFRGILMKIEAKEGAGYQVEPAILPNMRDTIA